MAENIKLRYFIRRNSVMCRKWARQKEVTRGVMGNGTRWMYFHPSIHLHKVNVLHSLCSQSLHVHMRHPALFILLSAPSWLCLPIAFIHPWGNRDCHKGTVEPEWNKNTPKILLLFVYLTIHSVDHTSITKGEMVATKKNKKIIAAGNKIDSDSVFGCGGKQCKQKAE